MRNGYYIMLAKQVYHTACRISYRVSDISLKIATIYSIILSKEGAVMSENKLLDLSFEFAVAIVNLVDGVTAPKSSYMTVQLARAGTSVGANIHEAQNGSPLPKLKRHLVRIYHHSLQKQKEIARAVSFCFTDKRYAEDYASCRAVEWGKGACFIGSREVCADSFDVLG